MTDHPSKVPGGRAASPAPQSQVAHRKCGTCDWDAQIVESPNGNMPCPQCGARTERLSVVGVVVPPPSGDSAKNPLAVLLGQLGGAKGGRARANSLSPRRRQEIARKAARARWHKHPPPRKPR